MELKSIPSGNVDGDVITLNASESTGNILKYGWQLDINSPTDLRGGNMIYYSPFMSRVRKPNEELFEIKAKPKKPGTYVFGLTVYGEDNERDYATVTVEIK